MRRLNLSPFLIIYIISYFRPFVKYDIPEHAGPATYQCARQNVVVGRWEVGQNADLGAQAYKDAKGNAPKNDRPFLLGQRRDIIINFGNGVLNDLGEGYGQESQHGYIAQNFLEHIILHKRQYSAGTREGAFRQKE